MLQNLGLDADAFGAYIFNPDSAGVVDTVKRSYDRLSDLLSADTALFDERILGPLAMAAQRSVVAALRLALCLASLVLHSSVMTLKLLVLVFPHLLRLGGAVAEFHRTQLTYWDMIVEFLIIAFVLILFLCRVRIASFWSRLQKRADKRYRMAAKYAPHVIFFLVALAFAVIGRKFLLPVCSSAAMPLLIIAYPLYSTLHHIMYQNCDNYSDALKYWIVVSLYFATKLILSLIPFSGFLFKYLYVVQAMVLTIAVWIQVSSICVDIVFDAMSPVLNYYVNKIPAADFGSQYGSAVLNGLQFARVISAKTALMLQNLLGDTMSVLICVIFSFTPTYLATFGVAAVVMVLPAFKTSKIISSSPHKLTGAEISSQLHWLKYWSCFGFMVGLECAGIKLWCSFSMVFFTWLQHSYLLGASKLFAYVYKEATALSDRHSKMRSETESASTTEVVQEANNKDVVTVNDFNLTEKNDLHSAQDTGNEIVFNISISESPLLQEPIDDTYSSVPKASHIEVEEEKKSVLRKRSVKK